MMLHPMGGWRQLAAGLIRPGTRPIAGGVPPIHEKTPLLPVRWETAEAAGKARMDRASTSCPLQRPLPDGSV